MQHGLVSFLAVTSSSSSCTDSTLLSMRVMSERPATAPAMLSAWMSSVVAAMATLIFNTEAAPAHVMPRVVISDARPDSDWPGGAIWIHTRDQSRIEPGG